MEFVYGPGEIKRESLARSRDENCFETASGQNIFSGRDQKFRDLVDSFLGSALVFSYYLLAVIGD